MGLETAMIGIRHEDKNRWEARVPLVPRDVEALVRDDGIAFTVQPSPVRRFPVSDFETAGAAIRDDLSACPIVIGVKEIPPEKFLPNRTYVFFSHTIKGQAYNMPMLRRLMELKCTLIDYEPIKDDKGRRLVFFGGFAGRAGMIDTLWALGRRWKHEGIDTPLAEIRQAFEYDDLEQAKSEIAAIGDRIKRDGLPEPCRPLVCGFAGYGQVSQGAQEIFDLLPTKEVQPADLAAVPAESKVCFKSVFHEKHMVERIDSSASFDLQEYYDHPDRYRGTFFTHVPHLTVLVTGIYWEPKYPRLITQDQFRELYGGHQRPRLRVIGDITCDIDGAVQCTVRATESDNPIYVYDPQSGEAVDGVAGNGPVVLAVDNLPCELPVDASTYFSCALRPFVPGLAKTDFSVSLEKCGLPPELRRATILYHGELTEPFRYIERSLRK